MGNIFADNKKKFSENVKRPHILMLGLDNTGKTTLFNRLDTNKDYILNTNGPTIGYNVQPIRFRHMSCRLWDVGGKRNIRPLWKHYFTGTDALIYLVDSTDSERFCDAQDEIIRVLSHPEMKGVPVLILANKQDLKTAKPISQIRQQMGYSELAENGRTVIFQGISAKTGKGVPKSIKMLQKILKQYSKQKLKE